MHVNDLNAYGKKLGFFNSFEVKLLICFDIIINSVILVCVLKQFL